MKKTNLSTVIETEFCPSKKIKEYILTNNEPGIIIHHNYWDKYILQLKDGKLLLESFHRIGSELEVDEKNWNMSTFGKCNSINEIELSDDLRKKRITQVFGRSSEVPNPYCGYIFRFLTEEGMRYFKLYISDYETSDQDKLLSITVQYQILE